MKTMLHNLMSFFRFFGRGYLNQVKVMDHHVSESTLKELVDLGQGYFPKYGKTHWRSLSDLLADFRAEYPFSITLKKLPQGLVGIFVPGKKAGKKGAIILNSENSDGMHLSTVAHENGHLLNHLRRLHNGEFDQTAPRQIYARVDELEHCLHDPEELLADYIGCMGAYPLKSFKEVFCNSKEEVSWIYRSFPLVLFLRAGFYVWRHYPELMKNFIFTENRLFHLCLTLHFVRLRVFIYENYRM